MTTRQTVTIQGPDDRQKIATWARNVEAGTVVTFRKKSRSSEQSAKMWAMLGEVSAQVEWYGQKLDAEDWKDVFTASLRHARVVPGIDKGTYVPLGMHTSTLTIEEMSNLIELIYAFGAEHNVVFKEPQTTESGSPQPDAADASPPASAASEEAGNPDPVSSPNSNSEASIPVEASDTAGDPPPSPSGSPATETEREILIRFARDVLPMAADTTISPSAAKAVEKEWAAQIKELSPDGIAQARTISESMRMISNSPAKLDRVLEHYAEVLETTAENLRGEAHG